MATIRTQVVVVGGGIAGLACAHRLAALGIDALVLEAGPRAGGKTQTINRDGVEFEAGPNTLILNRQPMVDLIRELNLEPDIIDGSPAAKKRWITIENRLYPLPNSPLAALRSPLLGPAALLRALSDAAIPRLSTARPDESVASFITRRFGRRILDNLVAPFLAGVYAGDVDRLEAASILAPLFDAERSRGSVIRGLIAAKRAARRAGTPHLPMRSITFRGGLESLSHALSTSLGDRLLLNSAVQSIIQTRNGCRVMTSGAQTIECSRIVIATSASVAADLISDLPGAPPIAPSLRARPVASLAVAGLLYDRSAIDHPLDGFGYLNGPGHSGPVLGCLFRSSVFPHTAPAGHALLVVFVGGARHLSAAALPESVILRLVQDELAATVGASATPSATFLRRWPDAIPQYNQGHTALRAAVEAWSASAPVSIVGSALTGVSLNDCVTAGRALAERLASLPMPAPSHTEEPIPCPSA